MDGNAESHQLTVLCRGHGSRINVHIRIDLNGRHLESGRFQEETGGRGCVKDFT